MSNAHNAQAIAETIIAQLGGTGKLRAMVGASGFMWEDNGALQFKFRGCSKFTHCKVTLDASDTYTVRFSKFNAKTYRETIVDETSGVYAEDLKRLFESKTGLYLSL